MPEIDDDSDVITVTTDTFTDTPRLPVALAPVAALTACAFDAREGMTLDELADYLNDTRAVGVPGSAYVHVTTRRGRVRAVTASGPWVAARTDGPVSA